MELTFTFCSVPLLKYYVIFKIMCCMKCIFYHYYTFNIFLISVTVCFLADNESHNYSRY